MKLASSMLLTALLAVGVACGYSSKPTTPASAGTMPNISALAPDNTNAGGAAFVLTVNGANFNSDAVINWNNTAQTTTFVSASQVMATIPEAEVATAGSATVTVTNPGTAGGTYGGGTSEEISNSMTLTIN